MLRRTSQTASLRRVSITERKTSLFTDDTDYVIHTGTPGDVTPSLTKLRETDSITEDNLDIPLERIEDIAEETPDDLEEEELAGHTHSREYMEIAGHTHGRDYMETGFSSPSSSEVEMRGGPKALPIPQPRATASNRFNYASQGPSMSSTPQHSHSDSLTSSSDKQIGMEASYQESPLLSRQQNAKWPLPPRDRAASSAGIQLGGGIQFDGERFEQYFGAEHHNLRQANYLAPRPASAGMHQSHHTPFRQQAHGHTYQDEHVRKSSLSSSIAATQGDPTSSDPRSYTPSSVVSSSVGGSGYTHQRVPSWIVDDASESDNEGHQQYQTADQPTDDHIEEPYKLRRIHSDVQMRRPPSEMGVTVSPSMKHTTSAGPDRFGEIMKKKRERRKSYKDFHGYPSINEWFEDIWAANLNSQQPKEEEEEEPKGRPSTLS